MTAYTRRDREGRSAGGWGQGAGWASCVLAGLLLAGAATSLCAQGRDKYAGERRHMVDEYIEKEGVANERVLESVRTVPRHMFVPPAMRDQAYYDHAIPIGHKQTISPPFIVAYMTETIDPQPNERVLEIGTGSGYQAAVLSGLAKDVYTIEIVEELGRVAAKRLKDLHFDNVHCKIGDGYKGWPEAAPFDKIIVTCSPEKVPEPLVEQLREGGKLLIPLGERYQQVFWLFEKQEGKLKRTKLVPTLFVPMTGRSEDERDVKPDPTHPKLLNASFEVDTSGQGNPDNWHMQRQMTVKKAGAPEGNTYVHFENVTTDRPAQCLQGMGLDGRSVGEIKLSLSVRGENIKPGTEQWARSAIVVHFFDVNRKPIAEGHIGPWQGTFDWKKVDTDITVPQAAREAIVQVGLNGATGTLDVDGIQFVPKPRRGL